MNSEEVCAQLEQFLRNRFKISANDKSFSWNVNLWEQGYVDSLSGVEVITYLEKSFKVKLPDDIFFNQDNTSIAGLAKLVVRLSGSQ